jgi:hypothetical protein
MGRVTSWEWTELSATNTPFLAGTSLMVGPRESGG